MLQDQSSKENKRFHANHLQVQYLSFPQEMEKNTKNTINGNFNDTTGRMQQSRRQHSQSSRNQPVQCYNTNQDIVSINNRQKLYGRWWRFHLLHCFNCHCLRIDCPWVSEMPGKRKKKKSSKHFLP